MTTTPQTYFVTLNWNTTGLLMTMARSIHNSTPEPHTWIIVDNGSDDENHVALYDWAHSFFSGDFAAVTKDAIETGDAWNWDDGFDSIEALFIRSDVNLGCILGHNLAFDVAQLLSNGQPHEIVMIDTDVEVHDRGWLTRARAWAEGKPVGIIGFEHSQREACAPAVFLDTNGNWYIHETQTLIATPAEGESVGLGFALVRWPVLRAGLRFDPAFKMYYKQDDDFCFQVRADLGLEVWAFPVGCVHWGSGSLRVNQYTVGDARGWDEFDAVKRANQHYFTEKWRWALRDRRRNLGEQAVHLTEMKRVFAERRNGRGDGGLDG